MVALGGADCTTMTRSVALLAARARATVALHCDIYCLLKNYRSLSRNKNICGLLPHFLYSELNYFENSWRKSSTQIIMNVVTHLQIIQPQKNCVIVITVTLTIDFDQKICNVEGESKCKVIYCDRSFNELLINSIMTFTEGIIIKCTGNIYFERSQCA